MKLKKIILSTLFIGSTLFTTAQTDSIFMSPSANDTPPEFEYNYNQLVLSLRDTDYKDYGTEQVIIYHDSVYINRLYSLPTEMEMSFNPIVKNQIELYAGRRKNQVSYMLGEAKYYFPIFEEALDREGLPLELKYLPVIESALNAKARSRAGASGLWQFMAATGKRFGLEINTLVDERFDPHKSTNAAMQYLKFLYERYGDWNLVIAAYNCGEGRVDRAIKRSNGAKDFWVIYPHLPRETRNYVPIFIAATYIMNYFDDHGIQPAYGTKPMSLDSIMVNKNLHFQQISEVLHIPVDDIRKYNPQFKKDVIPGDYKPYSLNLPAEHLLSFIGNENTIYTHKANEYLSHRKVAGLDVVGGSASGSNSVTYRVKRGDTMSKIANRYGVTVAQIRNWNGLSSNRLSVGRRLKIYRDVPAASATQNTLLASNSTNSTETMVDGTKMQAKTSISYYKVRKGDTWAGVAKKNGATIAQIKSWNNIKNNKLIAGKTFKIVKTEYIPVIEEPKMAAPMVATIEIDSTFTASLYENYLKKTSLGNSSLPLIHISANDEDSKNNARSRSNVSNDSKIIYHKVKIGETMTQIAERYKVSKNDIATWNKLSSNMAKVGQRLLILLPDNEENEVVEKDNTQESVHPAKLTANKNKQ